jgi:2'-5' RNA ligase
VPDSAVLIPVPEAESLVGEWRARFDAAENGVPAHVTLLYPFAPTDGLDQDGVQALRGLLGPAEPFAFALVATSRFPSVLYLRPEPVTPFRSLIDRLVERFPRYPPYGGAFGEPVPHLTVARSDRPDVLDEIDAEVSRGLPVAASAGEAVLMVEDERGIWRVAERFPFDGG